MRFRAVRLADEEAGQPSLEEPAKQQLLDGGGQDDRRHDREDRHRPREILQHHQLEGVLISLPDLHGQELDPVDDRRDQEEGEEARARIPTQPVPLQAEVFGPGAGRPPQDQGHDDQQGKIDQRTHQHDVQLGGLRIPTRHRRVGGRDADTHGDHREEPGQDGASPPGDDPGGMRRQECAARPESSDRPGPGEEHPDEKAHEDRGQGHHDRGSQEEGGRGHREVSPWGPGSILGPRPSLIYTGRRSDRPPCRGQARGLESTLAAGTPTCSGLRRGGISW